MSVTRTSSLLWEITVLFVICFCCLSTQARYGGGSGEPNDPYLIYDANHMQAIGANADDWDKCFKLMADVNLAQYTGTEFNIIGTSFTKYFSGVFDGDGHVVSNFTYTYVSSEDKIHNGMFGHVRGTEALVKCLRLVDCQIRVPDGGYVGILVGCLGGSGQIMDCHVVNSTVEGKWDVGGLVGWGENGTISGCSFAGTVSANSNYVGGLVGYGLPTLIGCQTTGDVSGKGNYVGGLIGRTNQHVQDCYSTATVSGQGTYVGGLIGSSGGSDITNCYATGTVIGGGNYVGGIVGKKATGGAITGCYWNIQTSGQDDMCGNEDSNCDNSYGKTTAEMLKQSTFEDWDFINVWNIGENQTYPYLRTYPAGDIDKDGIVNFKDLGFLALHWLENYVAENKPPTVWITYPEDGARLMVGGVGVPPQTMIMAEANDYDGTVDRVEFFANDLKLGEAPDGSDGWNYLWQGYSLGWHVLTATAWDEEGLSGTSSPVNVEFWMPDPPPP